VTEPDGAEPTISLVVAVGENGVIGAEGALPWRLRSDLRTFRAVTMGKPMIMGRKTFASIGRVLDGRDTIVLTRDRGFSAEGVIVAYGLAEALAKAKACAARRGTSDICVIGGGEVFRETLPLARRLHVTHVATAPAGDVLFPAIAPSDWVETRREDLPFAEGDTAKAVYVLFERRS
jgi:dihydrofolate reductase